MKKTLIALAAVAATTASFAQSSVTMSGVVGFGYQQATNLAKDKGFTNTDLTFRLGMVEDLGGGLKASAAADFDTTGANFASTPLRRTASIGVAGGFGSVSIINTRSGDLLTKAMVAPSYLPDGMYDTSGVLARSPVDALSYSTPSFGGFSGLFQYVEANTDGNTTPANKVVVLGVNYANGPLAAGFVAKSTSDLPAGAVKNNYEAFATYDLGVAKLGLGLDTKNNASAANLLTAANAAKTAFAFGVSAPLGPVTVGVNYAKRGTAKVAEAVAKYDLSKRTNLNASFGKQNVDANSQYRIALVHNF